MPTSTVSYWNASHLRVPENRETSDYAKDKEKLFPRGSLVCDLGGGDGTDSFYFISKGHRVYLFDVSDLALKKASEKAEILNVEDKIKITQLDLSTDPIPTENDLFDIVYARLSLHYFYPEKTSQIFKDVFRVLNPEGTAYIVVKSTDDKDEMDWLAKNNQKLEEGIYSEYGNIKSRFTKQKFKEILENTRIDNYKINDYEEYFGDKKVYLKSKADKLLYTEIILSKPLLR